MRHGTYLFLLIVAAVPLLAGTGVSAWAQGPANPLAPRDGAATSQERRVALVIGNSAYEKSPLDNPVNDARDMAAKLRSRGFDVVERENLKTSQIGRTLREFRSKLSAGSVALVFYAGHGLQIKGENYLPTIDADIEGEEDVPNQSLSVRQVLEILDEAKTRLNLVFLDACRNNPFLRKFRAGGGGLAKMAAPSGTLISFATRPGSIAADGDGRNGLYTAHLLRAMDLREPIEQALKKVVSGVKVASRGQQEPWMEGSIEGDFYFPPIPPPAPVLAEDPARKQQEAIDKAVQEAVRRSNEQAAKERAALEASMVKMLQEALARQNAQLEEARRVRDGATRIPPEPAATVAQPSAKPATPKEAPLRTQASPGHAAGTTPDPLTLVRTGATSEWEYQVRDERFNTIRKLIFRQKAMVAGTGSLEQVYLDGKLHGEWVVDGRLAAIGVPTESSFVFSPSWNGANPGRVEILTPGMCAAFKCDFRITGIGKERITLTAGSFDATRIEGYFNAYGGPLPLSGRISLWYSSSDSRLLRQSAQVLDGKQALQQYNFQETIELSAIRTPGP